MEEPQKRIGPEELLVPIESAFRMGSLRIS